MISPAEWVSPRLVSTAFRVVRECLAVLPKRQRKLAFVERALSGWSAGQTDGRWIIHLRAQLTVTNPNHRDGVVVVRVQIGRAGLLRNSVLQDCFFCDIAGERVLPILSPGALVGPHTTATMQFTHPFQVDTPPRAKVGSLPFRIVVTDQLNRRHSKRIKLGSFAPNRDW
jgi:hypothetical protein